MAFELNVTVAGDTQLRRSFSRFAEDIKDLSPAFRAIALDFKKVEKKQFDSEGAYGSHGWKPLNPKYAAWKAKNFPGRPLMVKTGYLKESLTEENPWTIQDVKPLELHFGTRLNYALRHQTGGGRLPQRRLIDLTEEVKTRWMKIIQKHLVEKAKEEGLL